MKLPAPIAANETERLSKLRGLMVLDSAPEPIFDNLVQMASQICATPIALLTLVDEGRQWFKAQTGLPELRQTPRDQAFWADPAAANEKVFEIADATLDDRFMANPMVTGEPHIRFYAGAPLILPTGEWIGALCVIDRQARTLSPSQSDLLSQLAKIATDALLMRRDLIERELSARSLAFMKRTGRVAGVGGWEISLPSRELTWSDEARRIYEVADGFQPTLQEAIGFYSPAVRGEIQACVQRAIETGQGWETEWPLVTARGRSIWIRAVSEVQTRNGQTVRIVGAIQDITARKRLEQQVADNERFVRQITNNLKVRISYIDRDGRYRFVNDEQCRRFALSRESIIGRTREELLGPDAPIASYFNAVLQGTPQHFEFDDRMHGELLRFEGRLAPDLADDGTVQGFFATAIDITDRSRAERTLRVLTTILELSTDFVVQSDSRGAIVYMNPAARRVFGLAVDAPLDACNIERVNTPETNLMFTQLMLPTVQSQGYWQGETSIVAAGGAMLPVSHLLIGHRGGDGSIERFSAVMRDFSSEIESRQQSLRQTAILRSVTDALPALVCAVDNALRFRFVNNAFERWHGLSREQVIGQPVAELMAEEAERDREWIERALRGETVQFECHYPDRPGRPTLAVSLIPVVLEDGSIDGFVDVALDITEHRHEQERLQELAERDPLTELLNRAGFEGRLERALAQGKAAEQALLFIDLDHFKPVNDTHGHLMGDKLLQRFATRLAKLVRPTDAIARLGGDEFAILLDGVRDLSVAQAVAAKVLDAASQRFKIDGVELQIGASVGVALGSDGKHGGRDLLTRADAHLYRAKQTGRGRQASDASDGRAPDGPDADPSGS
ncbi:MAG: PAS domain S-box protein [Ideonella sp.]